MRFIAKRLRLFWEPRDLWVGCYWKRYPKAIDLYVCLVPCLPLNLYLQWEGKRPDRKADEPAMVLHRILPPVEEKPFTITED